MSDVVAPEQQLTRRQLRELRNGATAEPLIAADRDSVETETLPLPTRRTMREHAPVQKRSNVRHAPRAAVLTTLGVATIAAPLTGFVSPEQSAQAIGLPIQTSAPLAQSISALSAQSELEGVVPSSAALAANPNAATLALDLSARSQARVVSECTPVESGASGIRNAAIETTSAHYTPLAEGTYRLSSGYGPRWGTFHHGLDWAAPLGTPIYAIADGEVVLHAPNGSEGRSGNLVVIHSEIDGEDVWFWYGHMYDNGVYVQEGQTVKAGELIAGIGNKGFSTGPHLHLEIRVGEWSNNVDPAVWLETAGAVSPGTC